MVWKIARYAVADAALAVPSAALAWGHGGGGRGGRPAYGWRRPGWGGARWGYGGWGGRRAFYGPAAYWGYNGCYRLRPVWTGWGW